MPTDKRIEAGGFAGSDTAPIAGRPKTIGVGNVAYDPAIVVSRRASQDKTTLLHVPTGRFVSLYGPSVELWSSIESGTTVIADLVDTHHRTHGVPAEVAAFHVLCLLSELRDLGLIDYNLQGDRESAPLMDTALDVSDCNAALLFRGAVSGAMSAAPVTQLDPDPQSTVADAVRAATDPDIVSGDAGSVFVIPDCSVLRTIESLAKMPRFPNVDWSSASTVSVVMDETSNVSISEIPGIAASDPGRRIAFVPHVDVTAPLSSFTSRIPAVANNRTDVVLVVPLGIIIIIIIIGCPDPKPSDNGKSRQSCKTMCV